MFGERLRRANRVARRRLNYIQGLRTFSGSFYWGSSNDDPHLVKLGFYRKVHPCKSRPDGKDCALCWPHPWHKGWTKGRWEFLRNFEEVWYVR